MNGNVLVLTDPVANYGAAFLYNGLCGVLGAQHVYDFPTKFSYHGGTDMGRWGNQEPTAFGAFPWMPNHEYAFSPQATAEQLLEQGHFSFVFIESLRPVAREAYSKLRSSIKAAKVPVILHCGEDHTWLDTLEREFIQEEKPTLTLLREYPTWLMGYALPTQIIPFPFSAPSYCFRREAVQRVYDFVLMQGVTHPYRRAVADALFGLGGVPLSYICSRPSDNIRNRDWLDWYVYLLTLQTTWLGVSVRGAGYDTCRYWETAACTCPVLDMPDIVIPHDYEDGIDCLRYKSPADCARVVQEAIAWPRERLQTIIDASREKTFTYHTNEARVRYLFEQLAKG